MKICQINSVYGYGSTGKIVAAIHESLLNDNHESFVIYSRKTPVNVTMKNVFRIYSSFGVATHAALAVLFDRHGLYSRHSTKKIIEKIDEINPDIVHLHVIHGFYLNYPMLFDYLRKSNRKVVWTLHDCWEYTGYCAYYDYNQCDGWKTGCKTCKFKNTYPYRILSNSENNYDLKKKTYEGLNLTLASPSKWLDDEVSKSMMKQFPHYVVHNDVKLDDFYYENSDIRSRYQIQNKKIILAVANVWTKQKGFDEYLKLSGMLSNDCVIVMVGLSKKQIEHLPENIIGIERVAIEELRKWYSTADVYLNCTLEDNYPTVNLEASACNLPIITYNTGGSPESAGDCCIVVEKYDMNAICKILAMNFIKQSQIKRNHSIMVSGYSKVYKNVLKGNY